MEIYIQTAFVFETKLRKNIPELSLKSILFSRSNKVQLFDLFQRTRLFWSIPILSLVLNKVLAKYTYAHFGQYLQDKATYSQGLFQYEGYWKRSLKQINSAVLASQFRRVLGPLSKMVRTVFCVKDMW